ncbi:MAG: SRPBCC family protein [Actinomycetota bacterium]
MRDFDAAGPELVSGRRLLKVDAARRVEAPAAAVWAVLADHSTWTDWHEDYDEHEALTDPAHGLGARFRTKEWVLRSESEIVRWEPEVALGLMIVRGGWLRRLVRAYYSELVIEPEGPSACTVRYRSGFRGTWLFWLLSAYSVGQALGGIYFDSRASLRKLERVVVARSEAG